MIRLLLFVSISTLFAQPYEVVGIGEAAVDLLIHVDEPFLTQYVPGEKGGSCLCNIELIQTLLEKSQTPPKQAPGGSCANTIRGLAKLGEHCAFYSHIGTDPLGTFFNDSLIDCGITPLTKQVKDYSTGTILCMITPDKQRTFRAAFEKLRHHQLLEKAHFEQVRLVHFESYALHAGNLVEQMMELAHKSGAKISLDLSSHETSTFYKETLKDLIPRYVDILFANEDETRAFTGLGAVEGCLELQKYCPLVVVMVGEKGCLVGHDHQVLSVPGFCANVVDTTGAGDLFISGFLYGTLRHWPFEACGRLGNRLGASVIEVVGAQITDWSQIDAFLDEMNRN